MKRWDAMAKGFTKLGKEIAMAVKAGGPDPATNAKLRITIQNAKNINMPKDRIEAAIKRASSKEEKDYEEVVYEGVGPYGIGVVVETATDNPTRTVANVRHAFSKYGGALGKTGSLDFMFDRKGVFTIDASGQNLEELELELIDEGLEAIEEHEGEVIIYTQFVDFGRMQKALEAKGLTVKSAAAERIPNSLMELDAEQQAEVNKLIEKLEEDDDVQNVWHNMKETETLE